MALHTAQTFNPCTSRPDVFHCLVVETSMANTAKIQAKHTIDPRSLRAKATFNCQVIHASMPRKNRWQSGVWSCNMPGLPTHLVQEFNVCIVIRPTDLYEIRVKFLSGIQPKTYIQSFKCTQRNTHFLNP